MTPPKINAVNLGSRHGSSRIVNQIEVETPEGRYFCSYGHTIAFVPYAPRPPVRPGGPEIRVYLDKCWDSTATTNKYRCAFLGEHKKETLQKLKRGEYEIAELN
jgi:hypothetical protein